jgi:hypothetical protein
MVFCDDCGKTVDTNAASPQIARETVKKDGWLVIGENTFCPECAEKRKLTIK